MIIVGITGSIGSGKTTFAKYLAANATKTVHFESWQIIAEVANQLRKKTKNHPESADLVAINDWLQILPGIVTQVCHKNVQFEQLIVTKAKLREAPENYTKLLEYLDLMAGQPKLQRIEITKESKETFRNLLQWLGGYFVKTVGAGIWYDELVRRLQATPNIELATVGGVRFPSDSRRIAAVGGIIVCIDRPAIVIKDANEVTERERALIVPDTTIVNDAGLPELHSCAAKLWEDLKKDNLVTVYRASDLQA